MAEFKSWKDSDRTKLKDVVPLDTPYTLLIESSLLCNINCRYCAHSKHMSSIFEGNITKDIFNRVLHDAHEFPHKFKLVDMQTFGEPLCNPNLAEMITLVKKENITNRVGFITNGLLFNKDRIDEILDSGVDTIRISLQGIDSSTYKKICGANIDFDEFIENLTYLYNQRGKCKIRMKIADIAIDNIPDGKEKFESIFGPISDSIFIEKIIPIFQDVDYSDIDDSICQKAINGRKNVEQKSIHKVCYWPFYRLRVTSNGKVTAACPDSPKDIVLGDINENSLVQIWNGEKRTNLLKTHLMGQRFSISSCHNCMLPNDIVNESDILDPWADEILKKF